MARPQKQQEQQEMADPRVVGGRYLSGYWGQEYVVTGIERHDDWRGVSFTVVWADGSTTTHGTPWDVRRDKVLA